MLLLLLYQMKIKFLRVQYLKKTKIWDCNERQVSHYLQHSRKIGEIFLHVCMSQTTYPLFFSNYFLLLSDSFHRLLCVCVGGVIRECLSLPVDQGLVDQGPVDQGPVDWTISHTERVTDLYQYSEMIIFGLILTTFQASDIC